MRRKSRISRKPQGNIKTRFFSLQGGLNLAGSAMDINPGNALVLLNYEVLPLRGYRRIDGFERFNGMPLPSEASYWILNFDAGSSVSGSPEDGGKCYGVTSGATAEVLLAVLDSGSWAGGDAVGYVVLTDVVGTFQDNEPLTFTGAGDAFDAGFSSGFS